MHLTLARNLRNRSLLDTIGVIGQRFQDARLLSEGTFVRVIRNLASIMEDCHG